MPNEVSVLAADDTMRRLIEHQPQLFTPVVPNERNGAYVAEFLKALRQGLIEMYEKTPPN